MRLIELNQGESGQTETAKAASEKRRSWANLSPGDFIIVTVVYEGNDKRYLARVMQSFNKAITPVLRNSVYLERKDGKRVFLSDYVPPGKDPFGARFIFPRTIDGQPFLSAESGSLRFHAEYENRAMIDSPIRSAPAGASVSPSAIQPESPFKFKLDMKFKTVGMVYNGELEY